MDANTKPAITILHPLSRREAVRVEHGGRVTIAFKKQGFVECYSVEDGIEMFVGRIDALNGAARSAFVDTYSYGAHRV